MEFGKENSEKEFGESETFYRSKFSRATGVISLVGGDFEVSVQPVPWKMRLEMVIGMQIEILKGITKLQFYGSFQFFLRKET